MFDRIRPYRQRVFLYVHMEYAWIWLDCKLCILIPHCVPAPAPPAASSSLKKKRRKKRSKSALNGCRLLNYNLPDSMPGCVNYFFCSLEEVHFPPMVLSVLRLNYLQVLELPTQQELGTLSSLSFFCSHPRGHSGSFFLAFIFSVLTYRDSFCPSLNKL